MSVVVDSSGKLPYRQLLPKELESQVRLRPLTVEFDLQFGYTFRRYLWIPESKQVSVHVKYNLLQRIYLIHC